jgi:DmsE family decaheme c-type cytochrome
MRSNLKHPSGWGLVLPLAIAAVLGWLLAAPAGAATPEDCATCHEDAVQQFKATAHGRAFHAGIKGGTASCESCHGPGDKHVESGDPADILNPVDLKGARADASCLTCHGNRGGQASWHGGEHQAAGVNCVDCHGIHQDVPARRAGKMIKSGLSRTRTTTELCLSCHTTQRKSLTQRSSHPLREGKMDCASCHDPHGGGSETMLRADSANDLCMSCHQEKRGPFLWEHSPVREDCQTCHSPHGSNHPQLLVSRVNQLCQSCHLQGRHQTVAGLPTAMWNTNRACVNCHVQVHGSNHPSGPLFQR